MSDDERSPMLVWSLDWGDGPLAVSWVAALDKPTRRVLSSVSRASSASEPGHGRTQSRRARSGS